MLLVPAKVVLTYVAGTTVLVMAVDKISVTAQMRMLADKLREMIVMAG
jgi:hypothetical protein